MLGLGHRQVDEPLTGAQRLRTFVHHGLHEEVVEEIGALPEGHGLLGLIIDRPEPLLVMSDEERGALRAVVLGHGNDPVRYICLGMFVRRPGWLTGTRPWGVPPTMGWLPGITGIQVIVDAVNATRPVPGVFRATGHEYTADLPEVTVAAYGLDAPDPARWSTLLEHLKAVDAQRASHSRLSRASKPLSADGSGGGEGSSGSRHHGRRRRLRLPGRRRARH